MQHRRFVKMNICLACMCFASLTVVSARQILQTDMDTVAHTQIQDTVKLLQLQEVTVVSQSRPSVTKQAAPLQVMDQRSIESLGIRDLSEAVRRFSGVTVKDYGGIGGLKTVSIRSLGAHHTAVTYDGVSISDAQSGQVDISRFTLDNVNMVTLSAGLNDDIFQTARSYASAGVIDIKTQKPQFRNDKRYLLSFKLKGGSFGLFNPVLSYSQKWHPRWSASIHTDYMRANGEYPFTLVNSTVKTHEKRINSDIETFRMEGNVYGGFGAKGGSLETKLYVFRSERGLPGAVNFYNRKATERLWNDNSFVQARYKNRLNEQLTVQAVAKYAYAYSRYRDVNDKYAAGFQEDRHTQHEYYGSAGVLFTPPGGLSASLTTDYANMQLINNFLNGAQPRRNTSLTALAMQYRRNSLTATGSLLGTIISDEVRNGVRPDDRKRLSPAFAFSWQPFRRNAFRVRASYKDIFRVPTFTDLYYLRVGNTGLKPEKAKNFNAGLTWSGSIGQKISYLSFSADGYYNRVEDKIVALPTLYIWRMMNVGKVDIKGADVNLSMEIPLSARVNMALSGSYTCQQAIDVTNPDAKNYKDQIPYTPRHTGTGSATFETPWINISWLLTAVGERYALPQNIPVNRVDAYTEQSISLNRTFNLRNIPVRLQGEVINLADAQYDVIQYYPMPGRSWRVSIEIRY